MTEEERNRSEEDETTDEETQPGGNEGVGVEAVAEDVEGERDEESGPDPDTRMPFDEA